MILLDVPEEYAPYHYIICYFFIIKKQEKTVRFAFILKNGNCKSWDTVRITLKNAKHANHRKSVLKTSRFLLLFLTWHFYNFTNQSGDITDVTFCWCCSAFSCFSEFVLSNILPIRSYRFFFFLGEAYNLFKLTAALQFCLIEVFVFWAYRLHSLLLCLVILYLEWSCSSWWQSYQPIFGFSIKWCFASI